MMFGSLALAGCGGKSAQKNTSTFAIPVAVTAAEITDITWVRAYNGSLAGVRQAEPTAKIPETITALAVAEGDEVTTGQVIIEFDKYGSSSRLRQAEAVYLDAERNFEKYERLYQGGAVSERERDYAETQYKIAKADYEAARDQVLIKSPIDGIVTEIYVKAGEQTFLGQVLAIIAAIDTMRLTFDVPYFDARLIRKGAPVNIGSELDTSITAEGWVEEISESADPVTRTVSVKVLMANPGGLLRPGMYVTGEVLLKRHEQVLVVPGEALVRRGGQQGVFVVQDSLAHFSPVETGLSVGEVTQIISGVSAGDLVVTLGQQSLQDGTRVSTEMTD